jgi:quinol monooxygenase YgiN/ketosteroid isomerase-like protein
VESTILSAVGVARAKPERAAELGALLASFAERSRREEGCLQSWIHQDLADPHQFVFYEMWASEKHLARHLEQPYMKDFLASRMDYLEQDLEVRQLGLAGPAPEPAGAPDPASMNQRYIDAYNARDIDAVMDVYAPGAAAVWEPGSAVSAAAHRDTIVEFLKKDPKLSGTVRQRYVAGDTAALVVDWSLEVPDSPEMTGTGRGFDVLRKDANGEWRYVITNPFGSV